MAWPDRVDLSKTDFLLHPWEAGVGLTIQMLVLPVVRALVTGRTLWAPRLLIWATEEYCGEAQDWSCYFDSLQSTRSIQPDLIERGELVLTAPQGKPPAPGVQDFWEELRDALLDNGPLEDRQLSSIDRWYLNVTGLDEIEESTIARVHALCDQHGVQPPGILKKWWALQDDETEVLKQLPERWLRHGRGWLVSQIVRFLVQPHVRLRNELAAEKERLGMGPGGAREKERFVAIHLRKGDACSQRMGPSCNGLEQEMPQVQKLLDAYDIKTVYVASPDNSAFEFSETRPDLTWLHRTSSDVAAKADNASKLLGIERALYSHATCPSDELNRFMVDAYIMADATGLVVSFESNVPRLVYSIATGVYGCLKPFISISQNWCWRTWLSGAQEFSPLKYFTGHTWDDRKLGGVLGNGNMIRIGNASFVPGSMVGTGGC